MSLEITSSSHSLAMATDGGHDPETMEFTIEKGDTQPALAVTLLDDDAPVDLSDASTVIFRMGTYSEVVLEERASFVDRESGQVEYRWESGDTDDAKRYKGQFRVHYYNGETATFPREETLFIDVTSGIGH